MDVFDRFRQYIKEHGPIGAKRMCPKCGCPSAHRLVYCRICGKTTQWVKFATWVDFSKYILSRQRNDWLRIRAFTWPEGGFSEHLRKEGNTLEEKWSYMADLTRKKGFKIVLEECGLEE